MNEKERIKLIKEAHQQSVIKMPSVDKSTYSGGLFPYIEDDVLDEAEHLDSLDREEKVDFDADENAVNMNVVSPNMKGVYKV